MTVGLHLWPAATTFAVVTTLFAFGSALIREEQLLITNLSDIFFLSGQFTSAVEEGGGRRL